MEYYKKYKRQNTQNYRLMHMQISQISDPLLTKFCHNGMLIKN